MESSLGIFILSTVLMPRAALRLHDFEDRYKALMAECIERRLPFGVLLDRNGREVGEELDPFSVGTTAVIHHVSKLGTGRLYVLAAGERRFRVERMLSKTPDWRAEVSYLPETAGPKARTLRDLALELFRDYLQMLLSGCRAELDAVDLPADEAAASYIIADALQVEPAVKQVLLEKPSASERLAAELAVLEREIEKLRALRTRVGGTPRPRAAQFVARFSRN